MRSRVRDIKKIPGEVAPDKEFTAPVQNFKIKSYYVILDIVSTQTHERFNESSIPLLKDVFILRENI